MKQGKKYLPRFIKLLLLLFVLAGILFAGRQVYKSIHRQKLITEGMITEHWVQRYNEFIAEPRKKGGIVFFGDSHSELFHLSVFNDTTIINRGISGDFSMGLIKRIDEVISLQPSKIFIEVGTNDLVEQIPVEDVIDNYRDIIVKFQKECPAVKIYIQSVFPVRLPGSLFNSGKSINDIIRLFNGQLEKLAEKKSVVYINLYDHFVENGELKPQLTVDGVHLNADGYKIWAMDLKPYLENLE